MTPDAAVELLSEWEQQRGTEAALHFEKGWTHLRNSISELVAEDASWMVDEHGLMMVVGDSAIASLNLSGPADAVTLTGESHPIRMGLMEASFVEELGERVAKDVPEPFIPIIRRWTFTREDGFGREIAYWVPHSCPPSAQSSVRPELTLFARREAVARRLARAMGWPLPRDVSHAAQ